MDTFNISGMYGLTDTEGQKMKAPTCDVHQEELTSVCNSSVQQLCGQCSVTKSLADHKISSTKEAHDECQKVVLKLIETVKTKLAELEAAIKKADLEIPGPSRLRVGPAPARNLHRTTSSPASNSKRPVSPHHRITSHSSAGLRDTLKGHKISLTALCDDAEQLLEKSSLDAYQHFCRSKLPKFQEICNCIDNLTETKVSHPTICMRSISAEAPSLAVTDIKKFVCAITAGLHKDGTIKAVPGKEAKVRLFLWSKDVRSRPVDSESLTCAIICKESELRPDVKLRQLRTDTFEASFTLGEDRNYRLEIALLGVPVNGSPYTIIAKSPAVREEIVRQSLFSPCSSIGAKSSRAPSSQRSGSDAQRRSSNKLSEMDEEDFLVMNIGAIGRDLGQFMNPQGVCITEDNLVAVTDSNIGCIQIFNSDGKFLKRIGDRGRKPGQIFRPTGIAFLPAQFSRWGKAGYVVADYENKTVVVLDLDGNCLTSFGSAKLTGPKGIAVAQNGDILVVDNRSNSLFIFRCYKFFKKIWAPSSTAAHLAGPHYVAVSAVNGDIFVSDFHHHNIKIFDSQYNYRCSFGTFSADGGMGSFSGPTGIAADSKGVVVCDWGSGRIQVFDYNGSFLAYVTKLADPLYGPQGLTLASDGTIYACDAGNHMIRVYRHPLA